MKNPDFNEVLLLKAKPNKVFPDWMTVRIRFLRYRVAVACASCGRKSKHHYTLLMSFKAAHFGKHQFKLVCEPQVHLPLTPVCRDHPLEPMMPHQKKK